MSWKRILLGSGTPKRGFALAFATLLVLSLAPAGSQASSLAADPGAPIALSDGAPGEDLAALAAVVTTFSRELGVDSAPLPAILAAGLSPEVARGLAFVLDGLLACHRVTAPVAGEARAALAAADPGAGFPWAADVKACGEEADRRLDALSSVLDQPQAGGVLALWPILFYDGAGADTLYEHDYVLVVDKGGDDEYYNNAAGTVFDVLRNPILTPGTPARGCQTDAELNSGSGNCTIVSGVALLDKHGNDVYGRLETPEADLRCTNSTLVRRLATAGAGVIGVGILVDEQGDDRYLGKTLAVGTGHSGGFGHLRDRAGHDTYTAIRSSVGAGILVGLGLLEDFGGDDTYAWYDPVGGVIDNNNDCRDGTANLQGAALLGAVGILRDFAGADTYNAAAENSQGMGTLGGLGIFVDKAGTDTYVAPLNGQTNHHFYAEPTGMGGAGVFLDHA